MSIDPSLEVQPVSSAMSAKRQVGFLIVGAQKAGTTSLFEYVRRHPDVHMPPAKEIGFFSSDHNYARGWEWYSSIMFGDAPRDARCGEASVGYMGGTPDRRVEGNGSAPTDACRITAWRSSPVRSSERSNMRSPR